MGLHERYLFVQIRNLRKILRRIDTLVLRLQVGPDYFFWPEAVPTINAQNRKCMQMGHFFAQESVSTRYFMLLVNLDVCKRQGAAKDDII